MMLKKSFLLGDATPWYKSLMKVESLKMQFMREILLNLAIELWRANSNTFILLKMKRNDYKGMNPLRYSLTLF